MSEDKINVDYDIPPATDNLKADLLQELEDMKQFIIMQSGGHIRKQLFELPEAIKLQSLVIADLTAGVETLRLSIENRKNLALELVLNTTEEGKLKFSNDKARKVAVDQLLREDRLYLDIFDELGRKESELRREQIQLDYLENMFLAYRAIAGLREMR